MRGFKMMILMMALLFSKSFGDLNEEIPGVRTWTDSESKRTLEGAITDKARDGAKIEIRKKGGGHVWLTISRLIKADQEIANRWVKAENTITVVNKVIQKGGKRVIRIRARAGTEKMKVAVYLGSNRGTVTKSVKAGEDLDFEQTVYKGYTVTGYHGEKLIDQESALKKTGLQGS